ncbi:SRPBCC family protein [Mucilaginibacter segetis]|uniref:SRPBCC family protein n=1 Tax=Mucilaginibacter segetis TaxID=2793071 RepID=A0A934PSR5_9SPHI|nr:SRPBCC family protein [Mucilaginibacter segetis]MBK0378932.1 SRPBCC family protein [Mucilaginibacter segetis]
MSVFESKIIIKRPVDNVYLFLADMNNHRQLMPDNIKDWNSTQDEASFTIENITTLKLKIEQRIVDDLIRIIPAEKPPFDMELKWDLIEINGGTEATFTITADLNMMMKMLASKPLQKLADEETQRLATLLT